MLSLLQAEHYYSLQVTTPKEELLSWQERPQQIVARWGKYIAGRQQVRRCCYITADSATAASQNGFRTDTLSAAAEENQYFLENSKTLDFYKKIITFIFDQKAVVTHLLSFSNLLLCSRCKIHH
jgi:hypothetical protein